MLGVFCQCNETVKSKCIGGNLQAWRRAEFNGVNLTKIGSLSELLFAHLA